MKKGLLYFSVVLWGLNIFNAHAADVVIKSTTNRDDIQTGDYWIGEDFALGFQKLGLDTEVDYRGEYYTKRDKEPKINVYMRGYTKFLAPFPKGINVLYCYYPMTYSNSSVKLLDKKELNQRKPQPENASLDDDWQNYDVITVASSSYAKELNNAGIKAIYVPQFTNPNRFFPEPDDRLKTDILFVGSNWHDRTSLRFAIESGFDVDVYGFNWQGIVPDELYKGTYIANEDLHKYYSSAKIVLNDHRPDMKAHGFVNNRIYDATATGAMVVSDYMPEIEAAYGDSIPMYQTKEELAQILDYYLSHEEERLKKAQKAQEITLKYFTNDVVAKQVLENTQADIQ